jgi:hypothetical protein
MANNRVFYAIQALGFAPHNTVDPANTLEPSGFVTANGVQSVGLTTTFNLEQVFELGQLDLYENIEGIPDIEMTAQKVLDGYPLLYHLGTPGATSPTLIGRSNERTYVALNIYPDTNDNASGIPLQSVGMSGMFVSSLSYTLNVDGNSTEDVTFVGNNKEWFQSGVFFSPVGFDGTDEPLALAASGGVQRRENVIMGSGASGSLWPIEIPGINGAGYNLVDGDSFAVHFQTVTVSTDLGRTDLFELGRRGPYHRFVSFPIEVTCAIDITTSEGDLIDALADPPGGTNLTDQTIKIYMDEGTILDLGTKNKLASINYGGGDTGGGNVTTSFQYSTFNKLDVTHPQDPANQ